MSYYRLAEAEACLRVSAAERATALAITHDGNYTITGTQSGQVLVHNLLSGDLLGVLQLARGRHIGGAIFGRNDSELLVWSGETLRTASFPALVMALSAGRDTSAWQEAEVLTWSRGSAPVVAVALPLLRSQTVVGAGDKTVSILDKEGHTLHLFPLEEQPTCLCVDSFAKNVFAGFASGRIAVFEAAEKSPPARYIEGAKGAVTACAFNQFRGIAIFAADDKTLFAVNPEGTSVACERLPEGGTVLLLMLPYENRFIQSLATNLSVESSFPPPAKAVRPPPRLSLVALTNARSRPAPPREDHPDPATFMALFDRAISQEKPEEQRQPPAPDLPGEIAEELRRIRAINHRLIARVVSMEQQGGGYGQSQSSR